MWQEWYEQRQTDIELVAIAEDSQPPAAILRWVDVAKAAYPVLHDREIVLYEQFRPGVTSTLVLDEQGRLARRWKHADLLDAEFRIQLNTWAKTGVIPPAWLEPGPQAPSVAGSPAQQEAFAHLRQTTALADRGEKPKAIQQLHRALELDPDNYVIQHQLGALERPRDYYEGDMPAINL